MRPPLCINNRPTTARRSYKTRYEHAERRAEYLAAMLAAYDGALLNKNRESATAAWLDAADKAIANGWTNTPDDKE